MIESENAMTTAQKERFEKIRDEVAGKNRGIAGIGTLSEKSVHAVLKNYYAPDADALEVAVNGFFADVCFDDRILEIQTRHFYTMKRKLDAFLPEFDVTVIYPVTAKKKIRNVDPETGLVTSSRSSPRHGSVYDIFPELYGLRDHLRDPHLHFKIVTLTVDEYRFIGMTEKHGRKKRVSSDCIPTEIIEEIDIFEPRDLIMFLPIGLGESFTRSQLAAAAGISRELAGYVTGLLKNLDLVNVSETRLGRELLYEIGQEG